MCNVLFVDNVIRGMIIAFTLNAVFNHFESTILSTYHQLYAAVLLLSYLTLKALANVKS